MKYDWRRVAALTFVVLLCVPTLAVAGDVDPACPTVVPGGVVSLEADRGPDARFLPTYVLTQSGKTDVGVFTVLLEVDSLLWDGHQYRLGTFTGTALAGPGFSLSVFEGKFRGDPAEISVGLFYLTTYDKLFSGGQPSLSAGFTVRLKL